MSTFYFSNYDNDLKKKFNWNIKESKNYYLRRSSEHFLCTKYKKTGFLLKNNFLFKGQRFFIIIFRHVQTNDVDHPVVNALILIC